MQLLMQLSAWAVIERAVVVADILEVVDLVARQEERDADGMHGCVSPTLVEELAGRVERLEELGVGGRTEEVHIADFKVGPD